MLVLTRFAHAISDSIDSSGLRGKIISPGLAKDWSAQFVLGSSLNVDDARGYKYVYAVPGSFNADRNGLAYLVITAAIRAYYPQDKNVKLTFPDLGNPTTWWINDICKSTNGLFKRADVVRAEITALNKGINNTRIALDKANNLVSQTPIDISKEWMDFTSNIDAYMSKSVSAELGKDVITFTPAGIKEIMNLSSLIASKFLPESMPLNIEMSPSILSTMASYVSEGLYFNLNVNNFSKDVQRPLKFQKSQQVTGSTGTGNVSQGEGRY
jgi:hypothetical protein